MKYNYYNFSVLSFPCQNGGKCFNLINAYNCDCAGTGYEGNNCETQIDECAVDTNLCKPNGVCLDRPGNFIN